MGVMKYFRHILMGHEILFIIFDGPQNIFLRFVVIILFKLRSWRTKCPTNHQADLRKARHVKLHPLSKYQENSGKNTKNKVFDDAF